MNAADGLRGRVRSYGTMSRRFRATNRCGHVHALQLSQSSASTTHICRRVLILTSLTTATKRKRISTTRILLRWSLEMAWKQHEHNSGSIRRQQNLLVFSRLAHDGHTTLAHDGHTTRRSVPAQLTISVPGIVLRRGGRVTFLAKPLFGSSMVRYAISSCISMIPLKHAGKSHRRGPGLAPIVNMRVFHAG